VKGGHTKRVYLAFVNMHRGEESMKLTIAILLAAVMAATAVARAETPSAIRKDAHGKNVKVKLTGKRSDCIRDGQKMGYSREAAVRYCASRGLR
jgi:hypothetical protein